MVAKSKISFATAFAAAVLMIAVVTPGAAAAPVLCGSAPAPVTNSANSAVTPAWVNANGAACVNQTVGEVCTASCRPGYTSWPAPSITCQDNGTWTPPTSTCMPVCKDPPAFLEDVLWGSSAADGNNNCAMSIGQKTNCPGVCLNGKAGNPVARCIGNDAASGTTNWAYTGGCVGAGGCESAPTSVPTNAKPNQACISGDNGTICELECNANYVANTDAGVTSTCVNGAWTNAGKCVKACTTVPTSTNVDWDINCAGKPVGYVCNGACSGGNTGSPTITCGAAGTWIRQSGSCAPEGGCPTAPPGINNAQPAPASCAGTAPGEACTYTCNNGSSAAITYGPSVGPAVTRPCSGGVWGNATAACIQVCRVSTLPTLEGGATWGSCSATPIQGKCMAACPAGQYGAPYSVCSSSGFQPVVGSCSATPVCTGVPTVPTLNGKWPTSCANTAVEGACHIACNSNLYTGTASVACVANAEAATGAAWATNFTGTMCAGVPPTSPPLGRKLI